MITDYCILHASDAYELEDKVLELCTKHYEPLGAPLFNKNHGRESWNQAMVLRISVQMSTELHVDSAVNNLEVTDAPPALSCFEQKLGEEYDDAMASPRAETIKAINDLETGVDVEHDLTVDEMFEKILSVSVDTQSSKIDTAPKPRKAIKRNKKNGKD